MIISSLYKLTIITIFLSLRAQEEYVSSKETLSEALSLENFQRKILSLTTSFSSLAQEMSKIEKSFNDRNVSSIIREIQEQEKEKLHLVSLLMFD